ncbi:MAG TPA: exo-alpha-sialidase [Verrucomicrobiota bacterium]|nr:exo-alpha-sialidase [Verrucomicrobiota bacterium]HNT16129.1 exo-alpha-sialidase [Verrucomicrobiota bacterium]
MITTTRTSDLPAVTPDSPLAAIGIHSGENPTESGTATAPPASVPPGRPVAQVGRSPARRPALPFSADNVARWLQLCWLLAAGCVASAPAQTLRLFVLTGQSNSLGTPTTNTEALMVLPRVGAQPAERDLQVPFFYDNTADGTPAGDAALGDSRGAWTNVCLQKGGYYAHSADHWGPEVGFARLLWDVGYRDFGIVKASRGGGGNSFWDKTNADHHMYDKVVNTVSNAVLTLPPGYTDCQIVGLLYLQGESNDSTEAGAADTRFASLLANLRTDLANATDLQAVIGQIAADSAGNRLLTTQRQQALANSRADIGFAPSTGLTVHNVDGQAVHYNADSLIVMGERMAGEAIRLGMLPETILPQPADLHAWYRGDHGVIPTAQATVARWVNLCSGAPGRDLAQIVGTPTLTNSYFLAATQRSFVRFDGAAQAVWATAGNFGALNSARTLLFAARVTGAGDGFLFDGSTGSGMSRAQVRTNTWQVGVQVGPAAQGPNADAPTAPRTIGVWQFHEFGFTPTNSGTRVRHWINGTNVADFVDPQPNGLGGLIVAANVQAQRCLSVDIGELLVYAGELTPAGRSNALAYLATNWASSEVLIPPVIPDLPPFIPVFQAGVDGYTCFRIPALLTTHKGTVIAMSDGRIGGCGDIPTPLDLVIKRSFDNGRTWGPLQVVTDYGSRSGDVDTYPFYGQTNIARVSAGDAALLLDESNGRIWTLYDNGGVTGGARKIKLEMKYSDDDGASWSPRIDVEAQNPGIRTSTAEFLTGPGNGLQIHAGPYAGRLVFPVYAYNNPSASMVIYSDDHGVTWQRSVNAITNGGEIQVAELAGGELIASCRDNGFPWSGVRTFSRSTNGGTTWGLPYTDTVNPPTLPDPQCQGNIYTLTTTNNSNASRILHANAAHPTARVNLTLRLSYDNAVSWPVSHQVYAGGSAYSAVSKLATGEVGLLFEKDPYGNLDFTWRSIAHITDGADSLPAYDLWKAEQFSPEQLMDPGISGPDADPDGDGFTNQAEFTAGTNPLSAASRLQLRISPTPTNVLLSFDGVANKSYTIEQRADWHTAEWSRWRDFAALTSNTLIATPLPPTNAAGFFRLVTPHLP